MFRNLLIFPTIFLPTNPSFGPHYENLLQQPLRDLAVQIPLHKRISIWHSMVVTAMPVEGAITVAYGVLLQILPDLTTGAPQAMATDLTRR